MLSTGTGIAPFMSIIRDPSTYEKFKSVILCHTTRTHAEHTYQEEIHKVIKNKKNLGRFSEGPRGLLFDGEVKSRRLGLSLLEKTSSNLNINYRLNNERFNSESMRYQNMPKLQNVHVLW